MSSNDNHTPTTFREVGIFLREMKDDIGELKDDIDKLKTSIGRLMSVVFTALIAPIMVGIILAFVVKPSK